LAVFLLFAVFFFIVFAEEGGASVLGACCVPAGVEGCAGACEGGGGVVAGGVAVVGLCAGGVCD
jgi:hypothetical protein